MKVLVTGASGFFGRNVVSALAEQHEVYSGTRSRSEVPGMNMCIDLLQPETIRVALRESRPDVIVNCAGIVNNDDSASQNPLFTRNLLDAVLESGLSLRRIIILGSAAEYGVIEPEDLPVDEEQPARPTSLYGKSKAEEVAIALDYRQRGLPVVVARPFNPIGAGMPERQLIPRILHRIKEIRVGSASAIEVSRLDALRDYIDVADAAQAIGLLIAADLRHDAYNIGSGKSTSNGEFIRLLVRSSGLPTMPEIIETSPVPEPTVASQADITRMRELGWAPARSLEETVKEIVDASGSHSQD